MPLEQFLNSSFRLVRAEFQASTNNSFIESHASVDRRLIMMIKLCTMAMTICNRRRQRLEGGSVFKELLLTANRTVQELP